MVYCTMIIQKTIANYFIQKVLSKKGGFDALSLYFD